MDKFDPWLKYLPPGGPHISNPIPDDRSRYTPQREVPVSWSTVLRPNPNGRPDNLAEYRYPGFGKPPCSDSFQMKRCSKKKQPSYDSVIASLQSQAENELKREKKDLDSTVRGVESGRLKTGDSFDPIRQSEAVKKAAVPQAYSRATTTSEKESELHTLFNEMLTASQSVYT